MAAPARRAGEDPDGCAEVVVRAQGTGDEVTIRVLPTISMQEILQKLSDELRRPEILETGQLVRAMPNGDIVPIHPKQKLGSRRVLCFAGAELTLAPEKAPPASLDDFDEGDPEAVFTPRSLQACEAEGIFPQELLYTPLEAFEQPGLEPRLVRLRHDFLEAYRQDLTALARKSRRRLVERAEEEEEEGAEAVPRGGGRRGTGEVVVGRGGVFLGSMADRALPSTLAFFEGTGRFCTAEKVLEGSPKSRPMGASEADEGGAAPSENAGKRRPLQARRPADEYAKASPDQLEDLAESCAEGMAQLRCLGWGERESIEGMLARTELLAISQRRKEMAKFESGQEEHRRIADKLLDTADFKRDLLDIDHEEVEEWHRHRDENHLRNRGPWRTRAQEKAYQKAAKRSEHWQERRSVVHQRDLTMEQRRNDFCEKHTETIISRTRHAAHLKDLAKVITIRRGLDSRVRWAINDKEVAGGHEAWKASIQQHHAEAEARVQDQRMRMHEYVVCKRELKALRRALVEMTKAREERRVDYRRRAVADELRRLAEGDPQTTKKWAKIRRQPNQEESVPPEPAALSQPTSPTKPQSNRAFPRFDFPRLAADLLSPTTTSTTCSPHSRLGASMSSPCLGF